jgi:hypothetical protein
MKAPKVLRFTYIPFHVQRPLWLSSILYALGPELLSFCARGPKLHVLHYSP